MEQFVAVAFGLIAGIITGVIPGAGVTVAMIVATPLLMGFDVLQLLLFYMALASMVQFTGTIPAVYLGVPGETNSLPAVIEGTKFSRHGLGNLAIGVSAIGSVFGSIVAVGFTFILIGLVTNNIDVFFSNHIKFYLYIFIISFCILIYNKKNILVNSLLCLIGFVLSLPGESDISTDIRYTFGFADMEFGIPLMPVLIGFLVLPTLWKMFHNTDITNRYKTNKIGFVKVLKYFYSKCLSSSIRGSVIGYFCGFVPGVATVLSTNTSYSTEKKINPHNPGKMLVASETANNSGQFASMLPLLLIGIPITGSEVLLYSLLVDAGWSPFQFDNVEINADVIFKQIVPWFFLANLAGLLIAWPLAKQVLKIFSANKSHIVFVLVVGMLILNTYLGILDYRFMFYSICLIVFGAIGLLLRKYETVPLVFIFILGSDIEAVFVRQWLI